LRVFDDINLPLDDTRRERVHLPGRAPEVLPHWPRERYRELPPKQWSASRARLRPEGLAVPLSAFEVPPVAPVA
jgi:hypothetical protein